MKFCPECGNLLYPKKDGLFCKFCGDYWTKMNGKQELPSNHGNIKKDDNIPKKQNNKKKIKILNKSQLSKKTNYFHFFPYEQFRESQEKIIRQIEESAKFKKIVLLVAPNGAGKTIIALSSILPIAIKNNLKIIYLCRTHSQNTRVIKELIKISRFIDANDLKNVKINGISIRGRNEMCLNKTLLSLKLNPKESMAVCRDLRKNRNCSHFLNLIKKRDEFDKPILIAPELFNKPIDAEDLIKFCTTKKLCPYFLSKFLLEEMRIVICNYNWIFNPSIRETFLKFIGTEIDKCILVIDECHNIIDVATDVNSERITPYLLRICLKDLEMYQSPILMQSFVNILYDHLNRKKEIFKTEEKAIVPDIFLEKIHKKLGFTDLNEYENFIKDLHEFSLSIHEEKLANGEISRDFVGALADFWLK